MDALTISGELALIQIKTRRLAVWSFLAHAAAVVIFLVVASQPRPVVDNDYVITEVVWLDTETAPVELAVAEPAPQPEPTEVAVVQAPPKPVIPPRSAGVDLMQQRLAALRADDDGRREITAAAATPTRNRPAPATLGTFAARATAPTTDLTRQAVRPVARLRELPKGKPTVVAAAVTTLPAAEKETPVRPAEEILPGVSLGGEVSNRRLVTFTTPEYPEWAKRDGVEVSVALYFTVLPSGRVKENVLIERTSGFDDFDRRAEDALAAWRFESLAAGGAAEQWGRIEFKYRLRDAG